MKDFATTAAQTRFDHDSAAEARARQDSLTKPQGSLGRLEELALFMAGWRATPRPRIDRAQLVVFAGNHGVCAQGVNPFPQEVTPVVEPTSRWGAGGVNPPPRGGAGDPSGGAPTLAPPPADFPQGPAMTAAERDDAMAQGAAAVDPAADVLALGEMGIGNSTVSAALCLALFGGRPEDWTGAGTGAEGDTMARKIAAVATGAARHRGLAPRDLLAAIGGREQAAICGAILAARASRIPVLLDGFICCAAAAVLHAQDPALLDHCLIAHASAEPGHAPLVQQLGKRPLLSLDMRLGEGSGAAVALSLLRHALEMHDGMATFAEAGIG